MPHLRLAWQLDRAARYICHLFSRRSSFVSWNMLHTDPETVQKYSPYPPRSDLPLFPHHLFVQPHACARLLLCSGHHRRGSRQPHLEHQHFQMEVLVVVKTIVVVMTVLGCIVIGLLFVGDRSIRCQSADRRRGRKTLRRNGQVSECEQVGEQGVGRDGRYCELKFRWCASSRRVLLEDVTMH